MFYYKTAALTIPVIFVASETHNQELNLNKLISIHKMHIFSLMCKRFHDKVKINAIMINLLPIFQLIFLNILR